MGLGGNAGAWWRSKLPRYTIAILAGSERLMKQDPAIFNLIIKRYQLRPEATAFMDDRVRNVEAAERAGMRGVHFGNAGELPGQLRSVGLARPEGS